MVVRFRAGPAWTSGRSWEQEGWDEHAAFVDRLIAAGTFVMGGPYTDHSGVLVVLEGVEPGEAGRLFDDDPFVLNGVFVLEDVRGWTVLVDELTPAARR